MGLSVGNMVNSQNSVTPNYAVGRRVTAIKLYLNKAGDVLLLGSIDPNYICWASLTKAQDMPANEAAFTQMAAGEFGVVSQEYLVLQSLGLGFEEMQTWYCAHIFWEVHGGMEWRTPFGHYYGQAQTERNGFFFAQDLAGFLAVLLERCRTREAGGAYLPVLAWCWKELDNNSADPLHYRVCKELIDTLQSESYLVLSDDEGLRSMYLKIQAKCRQLYNQYQAAVR